MKYCTDDGKHVFDTKEAYDAYMKKIEEEKYKAEESKKNKDKRLTAIHNASKALYDEIKAYETEYGEKPDGTEVHLYINTDEDIDFDFGLSKHCRKSPLSVFLRGFYD